MGQGTGDMPDNLKAGIEKLSGYDFSDVKVHYNSHLPTQRGAKAYTMGNDIHLAPGQEKHLPHEAWHVVQQSQGRVRGAPPQVGVGAGNRAGGQRLEVRAEAMAKSAAGRE